MLPAGGDHQDDTMALRCGAGDGASRLQRFVVGMSVKTNQGGHLYILVGDEC